MEREIIRKIQSPVLYKYMFPNNEPFHKKRRKSQKASFPFNPETEKWGDTILLPVKFLTNSLCQCCN